MPKEPPDLDLALCRGRQERFRGVLEALESNIAILTKPEQVQYLTGFRPHHLMAAAVVIDAERSLLIAPNEEPERHAADRVVPFEAQWRCTLRQDQESAIATVLKNESIARSTNRLAVEGSAGGALLCRAAGFSDLNQVIDAEPGLLDLRRGKDADEVAMIRHAIGATDAMYATAKKMMKPGVNELDVFNELQASAVLALGEPLTGTGNDYRANAPGGPPRDRDASAGELFILDLGPGYRGYFADNCRTFSIDGRPSDEQLRAREIIVAVLDYVKATVKPGLSCRELFRDCKTMLDDYSADSFFHHLGHGIGLYPHESPHLNPAWDDVFREGDVFTAEPGLYSESLRAGIRIEEDYLVTAKGVEQLTTFPTDL